ncbi:acyl-CoA synthetase, AMP-forming [Desulfuromonas soudanensis]|uniref:Acyl-CoA synthetase, AMP-forming n=1 Tax=Desulfuromonas soudanensis TaxID=1603606 RepID=A0A0M4DKF0_9BACT|nr:AMP-binding protein [Desulfuromonas soudanensis]ALC18012.1 acyl-CoA synthetase, AMP-forming [Desulfuromonas soudanensis]
MNIAEILQKQARERGEAPAIIDVRCGSDRTTTFAGLEGAAARGASLLMARGLTPGETVLVFLPMSAELYIALMALFRLGMTAMFIDPSAGREHIERCCAIRAPAALIASPRAHLLRLVIPALRCIPHHFSMGGFIPATTPWNHSNRMSPRTAITICAPETPALITFTSGSTGQPKAAVRSHGFLLEQHRVLERAIHLTPGATDLTTLPIFVLANLASGVTSLIPDADLRRPGEIRPARVLRQIDRFCPTSLAASPAFVDRLCAGVLAARPTIPGFRHVFTGGAPVFPDHLERFAATFPGAEIVAVYGSTEAEPIAHIARNELSNEEMSAMASGAGLLTGKPVVEIRAVVIAATWGVPLEAMGRDEFVARSLPSGASGEIVVSGGHVLQGYLNGVGDGETKFSVEGRVWHRTGDWGYFDARGRLWLLGRASAVIRDERGELHPFAVECAARNIQGVERAALVARNRRRILFVQRRRRASVDMEALHTALKWADLDEVRMLRAIPLDKRHNAKVDYTRLR